MEPNAALVRKLPTPRSDQETTVAPVGPTPSANPALGCQSPKLDNWCGVASNAPDGPGDRTDDRRLRFPFASPSGHTAIALPLSSIRILAAPTLAARGDTGTFAAKELDAP